MEIAAEVWSWVGPKAGRSRRFGGELRRHGACIKGSYPTNPSGTCRSADGPVAVIVLASRKGDAVRRAALASGASEGGTADCIRLFETILVSGDVKLLKPDPSIYVVFLERIGRTARECLFIDDSYQNIVTARGLGFATIHFESSDQLRRELQQRGLLPIEVNQVSSDHERVPMRPNKGL